MPHPWHPFRKLLPSLLLVTVLFGQTGAAEHQERITEQEYAVYSAFIDHHLSPGHYRIEAERLLLIEDRTNDGMPPGITLKEIPELADQRKWFDDENVIRAFVKKSKKPLLLGPAFKIRLRYKLISPTARRRFLDDSANPKPGVSGLLSLGRVRFNQDGTVALLSYGYYCGNMCAESGYAVLTRTGSSWSVRKVLPQVIS